MQTKNENDKYQVASTDAYGIKTTKGGQKYLICHFISHNFEDKYTYENVIDPQSKLATSILLEKECNKEEYFYEPFVHRAIGYVVSGYDNLEGFSVENANTDKKGDKELTKNKQECEFIKQLSNNLEKFKPHYQYDLSDDYWKRLENAVNGISGDLTLSKKINQIAEQYFSSRYKEYKEFAQDITVLDRLGSMASMYNCTSIEELKDIIKNQNKINSVPENNQMNISGVKISSVIINMTNKIFRRVNWFGGGVDNSKKDRLMEIVKNINEIIDIQFNKLGHKSILVRDAETKKIQKMKLHKFVDYIRDECKKSGIDVEKVNKNYPTSKEVHKKTQGFWCKIKSFFGFNHHDHNNAHADFYTDMVKNKINVPPY